MTDADADHRFRELLACVDAPAYMRRANDVTSEWNRVLLQCEKQRARWIRFPRLRLLEFHAAFRGQWFEADCFDEDQLHWIRQLASATETELTATARHIRCRQPTQKQVRAWDQLRTACQTFNHRWDNFVQNIDLSKVNQLRRGYNEYYVLEKECAMISPRVARIGFEPLPDATVSDLLEEFPLLPVLTGTCEL